jgi:hypothetical protein
MGIYFRGGERHSLLIQSVDSNQAMGQLPMSADVIGMRLDGKSVTLGHFNWNQISISPDYVWLLMYDAQNLYLYDTNDELIKTFPIPGIQRIFWRPDSQVIFYLADQNLYSLSIPNGDVKWVDSVNVYDAVWLP